MRKILRLSIVLIVKNGATKRGDGKWVRTRIGEVRIRIDEKTKCLLGISFEGPVDPGAAEKEGGLEASLRGYRLPEARTDFAAEVLRAVAAIPPGRTISYGELAKRVGRPGAARAVGRVMAQNAFAPVIPCHRVVPASGECGNYRWGADRKAALLRLEQETGRDAWRIL